VVGLKRCGLRYGDLGAAVDAAELAAESRGVGPLEAAGNASIASRASLIAASLSSASSGNSVSARSILPKFCGRSTYEAGSRHEARLPGLSSPRLPMPATPARETHDIEKPIIAGCSLAPQLATLLQRLCRQRSGFPCYQQRSVPSRSVWCII
jgi:hypothetical protein